MPERIARMTAAAPQGSASVAKAAAGNPKNARSLQEHREGEAGSRPYCSLNATGVIAGPGEDRGVTMRIGYAAGAFDLFHVGHLNLLRNARERCDVLIAGVVSDEMLREVKGIEPVIPTVERAEIVRQVRFVDHVHVETTPSKLDAWRDLRFTQFFKGDDWRGTPKGRLLEEQFAEVGVEIVYLPYTMHTSSTALRLALAALSGALPPAIEAGLPDTSIAR